MCTAAYIGQVQSRTVQLRTVVYSCVQSRTSFSITFSMYSTVRTLVSPVAGQTYSSVRSVIRSSNNFSFSFTASIGPGFVRNAIRGRGHFYNSKLISHTHPHIMRSGQIHPTSDRYIVNTMTVLVSLLDNALRSATSSAILSD